MEPTESTSNRLAQEKSPYLLQHAHNPVDWYPWGDEAFSRARAEGKPIFLSIGYSTCHWCHVMERESFENLDVAALLNEHFISIKVDREERPDVDRVYMTFVQATTGSGGWPMSVFLTPELKPFFGGTYFPPDERYGRPGFATLVVRLAQLWREQRSKIEESGTAILAQLQAHAADLPPKAILDSTVLYQAFKVFESAYDPIYAGFGQAPKFPRPVTHNFLLRYFARTGDAHAADMVIRTLEQMARGGIYDHLGGGFHRYSVDRSWHVPHFEKMLYDQAQLVISYLEAYQISGDPRLAQIARETLDYVLRDLTDPATGGFYCAEDADSPVAKGAKERAEGAFYVFTEAEIVSSLGAEAARVFSFHYGIRPDGNAQDPHGELAGKNILHVTRSIEETAQEVGRTPADVETELAQSRAKLLALRNARPRPHLDDKILCGWNGLAISAFARGFEVLGEERYLAAARRAAELARSTLFREKEGVLLRRYRAGDAGGEAQLEDYALLVQGLIDLYESTFTLDTLRLAERLTEIQIERFEDQEGGFYSTSGRDPSVLLRMKDDYDGAEPSGNSVGALNLLRLAELVGRPDWTTKAEKILSYFSGRLSQTPHAMPQLLCALDWTVVSPTQLVFAGDLDAGRLAGFRATLRTRFLPNRVLVGRDPTFVSTYDARLPQIEAMKTHPGSIQVYVCQHQTCQPPLSDPEKLDGLLPRHALKT